MTETPPHPLDYFIFKIVDEVVEELTRRDSPALGEAPTAEASTIATDDSDLFGDILAEAQAAEDAMDTPAQLLD